MDQVETDRLEEELPPENPEDVAVLYSWAKLQGAKYRDFSASRRASRAQLRHRAAEQQGEAERQAQIEAEAAAAAAERAAREAEEAARRHEMAARQALESKSHGHAVEEEDASERALLAAAELARKASMERIEAARRAEAVAAAEAAARREERELTEAHASAQRQARRYEDTDSRRGVVSGQRPAVGGEISDPYEANLSSVRPDRIYHQPSTGVDEDMLPARFRSSRGERRVLVTQPGPDGGDPREYRESAGKESLDREAYEAASGKLTGYQSQDPFVERRSKPRPSMSGATRKLIPSPEAPLSGSAGSESRPAERRAPVPPPGRLSSGIRLPEGYKPRPSVLPTYAEQEALSAGDYQPQFREDRRREAVTEAEPDLREELTGDRRTRPRPVFSSAPLRALPGEDDVVLNGDALPNRRDGSFVERLPEMPAGTRPDFRPVPRQDVPVRASAADTENPVPAWIHTPKSEPRVHSAAVAASPVEDTLQYSRERVASRWFALKGVFDQGAEPAQEAPKVSARAPILTVFSLAGGVGKTSLVATLGRALSSAGERVLLTDTTSHGLLPFYFGASDLRAGTVRTFTPPEGSSDAPIYMVSYDVYRASGDAAAQLWLSEELLTGSRGMQRVIVDLGAGLSWAADQLVRMNSTVLVPVAPDMNSVISLQGVEKYFSGMADAEGKPIRPYYLLNQFDAALPLHLDVREVMRQQLGDRLLPFTIRRSPQVSEALAEGMTVMDYAPESPVTLDYTNLVSWVRTQAPPAAAGFKHARWSER